MNKVLNNMASLGMLQVANFVIPLLLLPYVTRILGVELFGRVSYAQNIVAYLTLLINYGFEYSATRQIALAEGDKDKKRKIFWGVIGSKVGLLVLSFVVLGLVAIGWEKMGDDWRLYVYTAMVNIGVVFFPTWYLQGVQDMRKMAWVNFVIKVLGALLVVIFVQHSWQYRIYPLLLSVSSILVGLGMFVYVVKNYDLGNPRLEWNTIKEVMGAGGMIFLNQVFVNLYTSVNFTIMGLYLADGELGVFSGAQRIILAAIACMVMPVSTAVFPEMSRVYAEDRDAGKRLFGKVMKWAAAGTLVATMVIYLLADWIVKILLGSAFESSAELLRMMSPIPCLVMIATILTVQGLYGRGWQKYAPIVGCILASICIVTNMILIPHIGARGAVVAWGIAEVAEIALVGGILLSKERCFI